MDKYRRVAKEKNADKDIPEDEIRVSASGRTATYITYAAKLFNEKNVDKFTIKATGTALATAVTVAEIIKRRFKGLHQITKLGSIEIVDEYEPLEEGLDQVTDVRQVSFVEITLSKTGLDVKDKGYQPPISDDLVKEVSAEDMARGRGGRRGRGGGKGKSKGKGRSPKGKGRSATKGRKGKEGKKAAGKDKGGTKGSKKSRGDSNKGKGKWGGYDSYGDGSYGYDDSYGRKAQGKGGKGKGGKDFEKGKGKGKGGKKGQGKGGKYKGWY